MKSPILTTLITLLLLATSTGQSLAQQETDGRRNRPVPSPTISPGTERQIPRTIPPATPPGQPDIQLPGGNQHIPFCKLVPWCTLVSPHPDEITLPEEPVNPTPGEVQELEQPENLQRRDLPSR